MKLPGICLSRLHRCLCWLPSQAASPSVKAGWMPAAPGLYSASLTSPAEKRLFLESIDSDWPKLGYDPTPEPITVTQLELGSVLPSGRGG